MNSCLFWVVFDVLMLMEKVNEKGGWVVDFI